MMASEGVPRGNGHIGKKSAGQNARRWMTDSCLPHIMTKKNTSCAQCTIGTKRVKMHHIRWMRWRR
jgi:hypothetical protein